MPLLLLTVRRSVQGLVVLLYAYMCLAVLFQVLGRYVFNYSIAGAVETATFAQIWMVLFAAGIAMRQNLHNGVDIVAAKLPRWMYRLLLLISGGLCLWFLGATIQGSIPLLEIGGFQSSPALEIPMWMPYLAIPVGCAYFGLELVISLVAQWRAGGPPAPTPGPGGDVS